MEEETDQYLTASPQETQQLADKFAQKILKSDGPIVLALYGDLGSGKTTFVQGLAKALEVNQRIISPTFVIVRQYEIDINFKFFYHIDLYRVGNEQDIQGLGLEEIIKDPDNIVAIEWAEKMTELLPKKRWDIWFEYIDEERRRIKWKKM